MTLVPILLFFVGVPVFLTWKNCVFLFSKRVSRKREALVEAVTIFLGILFSIIYIEISDILRMDWQEVLVNNQRHTPISGEGQLTIIILTLVGVVGYLTLRFVGIERLSPIIAVTSIACMYIGIFLCIVWIIQITDFSSPDFLLVLFPLNCILIAWKTIKTAIESWQSLEEKEEDKEESASPSAFRYFRRLLLNAHNWTWMSLFCMIPVLGVFLCILTLFGQRPDALIRAWTQTSDWQLSQRISPPNVQYDEHYLCTVAASGYRKLVRPQRMGVRHGHRVVVNRQLCVANAFEQLLEEKIPTIHYKIRRFYDHYGYPIARRITSPFIADGIYLLMKPLEYLFLFVLYLFDRAPENRIALQYIPKPETKK